MEFKTRGTCSAAIQFEVTEDRRVSQVKFIGGCDGNAKGVSSLVEGMPVDEVIHRLKGISCGFKNTSCPDQLAKALEEYQKEHE